MREDIPGIDQLTKQIAACYEYKGDSAKEGAALAAMKKSIEEPTITCLRISDFHTTGVTGAKTNEQSTPFYNLTKGSGVSDKVGSSGGSKGIGKFASFVVSTTNTVFYSTRANDGSCGYIGISKLRSAPIPNEDPDLLTMGIGYYGIDDKNSPILEEAHLDKEFTRSETEYGTDVYIIGFNNSKGWQIYTTIKGIFANVGYSFANFNSMYLLAIVEPGLRTHPMRSHHLQNIIIIIHIACALNSQGSVVICPCNIFPAETGGICCVGRWHQD